MQGSDAYLGGYFNREGLDPLSPRRTGRRGMYIPNTTWTWAFLGTTLVQTLVVLAIEVYIFVKFQVSLRDDLPQIPESKTIPTYLTLFIFGFLYQLVLVWDSLRLKNTIQVIGLCLYNVGMLIYASIQFDQVDDAIRFLKGKTPPYINANDTLWSDVKPLLLAVPCIIALFTILMSFVAWKLYDEFAWTIYKHISADLRMKRRFLTFQIYIALLKFDFFFFLGFTVQFLVIVSGKTDSELGLTIAAIPITILILFMAAFWTRRENKFGMIFTIVLYFCGSAYFIYKLARMYQLGHEEPYKPVRKNLTSFASITILLLILTITNAFICMFNFNKGLKQHVMKRKIGDDDQEKLGPGMDNTTELPNLKPGHVPVSSRMTID